MKSKIISKLKYVGIYVVIFYICSIVANIYVSIDNPNLDFESTEVLKMLGEKTGRLTSEIFIVVVIIHVIYLFFKRKSIKNN